MGKPTGTYGAIVLADSKNLKSAQMDFDKIQRLVSVGIRETLDSEDPRFGGYS